MDLMSNLFNRGGGSSPAAGLVERATSELLIGPDWGANMELVDMVMNDTLGEGVHALDAIKRRIASGAPKSQGLALECLETLIKNCGEGFHRLPAHKGVLVEMGKLVTGRSIGQPLEVTNVAVKARDLIDEWAEAIVYAPAFREEYAALKARGVHFPPKDISRLDPDFIPGESPMYTGPASAAAAIHEADRAAIERAIAEADAEAAGLGGGGGSAAAISEADRFAIERAIAEADAAEGAAGRGPFSHGGHLMQEAAAGYPDAGGLNPSWPPPGAQGPPPVCGYQPPVPIPAGAPTPLGPPPPGYPEAGRAGVAGGGASATGVTSAALGSGGNLAEDLAVSRNTCDILADMIASAPAGAPLEDVVGCAGSTPQLSAILLRRSLEP
mmetsp:Transcript_6482/g.22306  ORF Transcript_6482/g.22306 Transcript_6482/m.22306 type:complete len:384 (-) Transcript_6482:419-1570(-)